MKTKNKLGENVASPNGTEMSYSASIIGLVNPKRSTGKNDEKTTDK